MAHTRLHGHTMGLVLVWSWLPTKDHLLLRPIRQVQGLRGPGFPWSQIRAIRLACKHADQGWSLAGNRPRSLAAR